MTISTYFKLHIRQAIRELYGKEKQKRIKQYEENTLLVHSAVFNTKDPNGSMNALMKVYFKEENKQNGKTESYTDIGLVSEPLPITEVLSSETEKLVEDEVVTGEEINEGMTEVLVQAGIPYSFKIRKEIIRINSIEEIKS